MIGSLHRLTLVSFVTGVIVGGLGILLFFHSTNAPNHPAKAVTSSQKYSTSSQSNNRDFSAHLNRSLSLIEIASKLGFTDPEAGWSQGMAISNTLERADFLHALLKSWATKDPEGALQKLNELAVGRLKNECLVAACAGWAIIDPKAAADWVDDTVSFSQKSECYAAIAASWAKAEPAAAAAWALTLKPSNNADVALAYSLEAWCASDPNAASGWVASQPEGELRSTAELHLAAEWAALDPVAASKWIAKETSLGSAQASEIVDALLNHWSSDDPLAAANWVQSLPEDMQAEKNGMVLAVWAASDPAAASAWAATFPAGVNRERAIPVLVESWAGNDPQAAVTWSLTLPESAEKSQALDQAVRIWSINQRDTLNEWINIQPKGLEADHLRATASIVIAESHPLEAATMAVAIDDPPTKQDTIVDVVRQWRLTDAAAAEEWLNKQSIDDETKHLLQP